MNSKGRFKKILNMMGKIHHHFFLDCLVERRNEYITRLYEGIDQTIVACIVISLSRG